MHYTTTCTILYTGSGVDGGVGSSGGSGGAGSSKTIWFRCSSNCPTVQFLLCGDWGDKGHGQEGVRQVGVAGYLLDHLVLLLCLAHRPQLLHGEDEADSRLAEGGG